MNGGIKGGRKKTQKNVCDGRIMGGRQHIVGRGEMEGASAKQECGGSTTFRSSAANSVGK